MYFHKTAQTTIEITTGVNTAVRKKPTPLNLSFSKAASPSVIIRLEGISNTVNSNVCIIVFLNFRSLNNFKKFFMPTQEVSGLNNDLLVKLIDRAEDEKEVSAIFQLGTQYYKTGLKYDVRLEKTSPDIHYLKKNKEKSFETDPNALTHKLIIGDNYYALLNLLISHRGLIDVIYIDPPYGCDSMGQFADTNYDNHITRDNLLSMLHTRLILAKQLLSETGVIFCSIDDRNQAYIKCLFDNVFGEENFIGNILRKTVTQRAMAKNFNIQHEYCLFYAKNINEIDIKGKEKDFNCYSNPDNDPNGDWKISDPTMKNSNNIFEIKNPFTNKTDMPPIGRGWCFTKEKMQELINNKVFIFKNEYKENERGFFIKKYKKDLKSNYLLVNSLELCDNKYLNENVKTIEDAIEGAKYIIAENISDNASFRKSIRNNK